MVMANPFMDGLRREHAHMRRVLSLMRGQLDLLERNEAPDFVLLGNALYYMRKFPGAVHHPKEELLFARLLSADSTLCATIGLAREQHKMIYELEGWLLEAAVQATKHGAAGYPQLVEFGRRYLLIQKEHSQAEDTLIFPRALKVLKPEDWVVLNKRVKHADYQPARGGMQSRYQAFYDYIVREAVN